MTKRKTKFAVKESLTGQLFDTMGEPINITVIVDKKGPKITSFKRPSSIPEVGHIKFYIHCFKLSIYTTMGADNIHHASNKATKLWGPNWSKITLDQSYGRSHQFCSVKQFSELLRTLQN